MTTEQQQQEQPGADVALPSERPAPPTLTEQVRRMEQQFALAAPRGVEAKQIVRDVLTALSKNPDLHKCTHASVLGGAMTMAQLGLRIGVLGHGWLVPFWNRKAIWIETLDDGSTRERRGAWEAQLIIGYQGLVELAHRSGQIQSISARTVHEKDYFAREYGVDEKLVHRPAAGPRGEPVAYYAVVRFANGGTSFYDMTRAEMEVYRDRYAMAKTKEGKVVGPWATEFDGMAKKTCVRQLSKFMPKGTDLAVALAVDDTVRVDLTPTSQPELVSSHPERDVHDDSAAVAEGEIVDDQAGAES
ncbi:recombinase RecT [Terrabacter terrigena]|uniref:Recombinase RecT n=1 Tax=Terrabacter terrigena TaxID=574718 RepID=A0ABW3N188_9MICO